ncbi:MAG: TetR/AcrR family transcriptional regulator [Phycisphaerae bacterium]|nr:TetR/AcrR family transcriptional regulator [Phycisphaerae bacterium]
MTATAKTAKPKPSSRKRLVDAARELFWLHGYEATAVAEILERAKVNAGSLYYYFKTKEELLLAVLENYIELLEPEVLRPAFEATADPLERIFAILLGYRVLLTMTECRQGCPIGNLALEMSEKSEPVRELIARNFENWRLAVRRCLIDAGPRLPGDVDRDKLATFILTVMEGSVMLARASRSLDAYDAAVAMLRDYIARLTERAARPIDGALRPADAQESERTNREETEP